ncbi:TolC family outer membrane protein [Parasulfuritortus cantonensis]|uniref:TolC family outer membrane protein n=1 Tax=Parasulfuritortus cantonensis TaxID=2528202 RepID=UPI0014055868|nr:TolC family outer membrane protein [Parasulfuritortus cantonensis]
MKHNSSNKARLLVLVGALAMATGVSAGEWTLKDAAQQAVLNNPEVLARWHAYKAATENIDVIKGRYLPSVDLSAAAGLERRDTPTIKDSYNRNNVSLILNQMLFDGFATRNEVAKFNYAQRVRYNELLDTSESAALEAMRAYVDVLRYRKLYQLAQENYVRHRMVFEQIEERVKSGVGRGVDLEQAAGRLALAESNLLTESSNLHDVTARYQRIVGDLPPELMAEPPLFNSNIPGTSEKALRAAYGQHPALLAAQENIVSAQNDAKVRHAAFLPRVDLRARQDVGRNLDGYMGSHSLSYVELLLNYNFYNGGSDQAAERQYWEQVNVAKDQRDKVCRDIRQTLYIAYNDVGRLKEQLGYLEQHQLSTEMARDAYRKQFDIGQRTLLDLLDTENELYQAKRAYQNGHYDYVYAMGRTQAGMGELLGAMGLQRLNTDGLANGDEKAEFDPDTVCPPTPPSTNAVDKDKLFAEAMANVAPPPLPKPIGDQDGDGVPDDKDKCPDTPKGTKVDKDGCPFKEIVELKGVHFDYNKTTLRPDSYPVLDQAAARMLENPEIQVEVAGHTDYNNTYTFNQHLSEARAKVVMDYLVSKGVAADRIYAVGYGETQPIADNTTEEGQARNRRVEMRVRGQ